MKNIFIASIILMSSIVLGQNNTRIKLSESGIKLFSDNSNLKPEYEGCGSYFTINESDKLGNLYIFTGLLSNYFWGESYKENYYIDMIIDNEILKFKVIDISPDLSRAEFKNFKTGYTAIVNLKLLKKYSEVFKYNGTLSLNKNGKIYTFNIEGESGC